MAGTRCKSHIRGALSLFKGPSPPSPPPPPQAKIRETREGGREGGAFERPTLLWTASLGIPLCLAGWLVGVPRPLAGAVQLKMSNLRNDLSFHRGFVQPLQWRACLRDCKFNGATAGRCVSHVTIMYVSDIHFTISVINVRYLSWAQTAMLTHFFTNAVNWLYIVDIFLNSKRTPFLHISTSY